jgi:hypothetical protein
VFPFLSGPSIVWLNPSHSTNFAIKTALAYNLCFRVSPALWGLGINGGLEEGLRIQIRFG